MHGFPDVSLQNNITHVAEGKPLFDHLKRHV